MLLHLLRSTYSPLTSFSSTSTSQQRSKSPFVWLELAAKYSGDKSSPDVWIELVAEYVVENNTFNKPKLKNVAAVQTSVLNSFVSFVYHDCLNPYSGQVKRVANPQQLPTISESDICDNILNSSTKEVQDLFDWFYIEGNCRKAEE